MEKLLSIIAGVLADYRERVKRDRAMKWDPYDSVGVCLVLEKILKEIKQNY